MSVGDMPKEETMTASNLRLKWAARKMPMNVVTRAEPERRYQFHHQAWQTSPNAIKQDEATFALLGKFSGERDPDSQVLTIANLQAFSVPLRKWRRRYQERNRR